MLININCTIAVFLPAWSQCLHQHGPWAPWATSPHSRRWDAWQCRRPGELPLLLCSKHSWWLCISPDQLCPRSVALSSCHPTQLFGSWSQYLRYENVEDCILDECHLLTYGGYKCCIECVLWESEEHTSLADTRVSDEQQFEEIGVCLGHDCLLSEVWLMMKYSNSFLTHCCRCQESN